MNDVAGLVWYNEMFLIVHGSFSGELAMNGKQLAIAALLWKLLCPR
ncbi:MAG: hypothetical protein RID09_22270 [Coleofasciculus sp. G1-WW12-02]